MSAMTAKVTDPRELHVGPDVDNKQMLRLLREHLTDEGRAAFLMEMLAAIREAKDEGNLGYVNQVIDAWTRTVLVLDEDFDEKWQRAKADAENPAGETFTLEEVKVRLGLA
jgi:hypothetical protein